MTILEIFNKIKSIDTQLKEINHTHYIHGRMTISRTNEKFENHHICRTEDELMDCRTEDELIDKINKNYKDNAPKLINFLTTFDISNLTNYHGDSDKVAIIQAKIDLSILGEDFSGDILTIQYYFSSGVY